MGVHRPIIRAPIKKYINQGTKENFLCMSHNEANWKKCQWRHLLQEFPLGYCTQCSKTSLFPKNKRNATLLLDEQLSSVTLRIIVTRLNYGFHYTAFVILSGLGFLFVYYNLWNGNKIFASPVSCCSWYIVNFEHSTKVSSLPFSFPDHRWDLWTS